MPKLLKPSQEGKHLCLFFIMGKLRHKCVKCFWQTLQDLGGKILGVQQAASTPPEASFCLSIPGPARRGKTALRSSEPKPPTAHGAGWCDHTTRGTGDGSRTWQGPGAGMGMEAAAPPRHLTPAREGFGPGPCTRAGSSFGTELTVRVEVRQGGGEQGRDMHVPGGAARGDLTLLSDCAEVQEQSPGDPPRWSTGLTPSPASLPSPTQVLPCILSVKTSNNLAGTR